MPGDQTRANGNRDAELPLLSTKRIVQTVVLIAILLVGIYFLFPKLAGFGDALGKLDDANPIWIGVAIGFNILAYATYIALFKAVVGGDALRLSWTETYEINMAGVAATLLFSAGGAGGVALTYWALRKAGMARRDVGRRMVAFVSLHYAFYPLALIVCGLLLRTGVVNGADSVSVIVFKQPGANVIDTVDRIKAAMPARFKLTSEFTFQQVNRRKRFETRKRCTCLIISWTCGKMMPSAPASSAPR